MSLLNSKQIFNKIRNTNRSSYQEICTEQLKESFYDSPNYNQITRIDNDGNSETLDIFIMEYDSSKQIVGGKKFLSYPYDEIKFEKGNYISSTINGESVTWLVTAVDNMFLWNINGKITKCNQNLEWYDSNNNLKSYPCVVLDKVSNYALDFFTHMITPNETAPILVQANSDTNTLEINDRMVLGDRTFKITVVNNLLSNGLIMLYVVLDASGYDDTVVADANKNVISLVINNENFEQEEGYTDTLTASLIKNSQVISGDIIWGSEDSDIVTIDENGNFELISVGSVTITAKYADNININDSITIDVVPSISDNYEIRIMPKTTDLYRGLTKNYSVYTYNNNVITNNTFTFSYDWDNSIFYTISNITNNGFSIKCNRETNTPLTITCTDNTTAETKNITINLLGMW